MKFYVNYFNDVFLKSLNKVKKYVYNDFYLGFIIFLMM